ncbi:hypothetical protein [uncultured Thiohalocapsa sp.]|uniref:hypothetical protein n=1 Tax=uncultured Thiohalocapsa sp. TaxID=768990 RepID=UPI0025F8C862|nr:hypothetical protein [uncultured Thiohalocapsa sp.]
MQTAIDQLKTAINDDEQTKAQVAALFNRFASDESLTPEAKQQLFTDKMLEIAKDKGLAVTEADLAPTNTLSDSDMERVAGGIDGCDIGTGISTVMCGVGAIFTGGLAAAPSGMIGGGIKAASMVA